MNGSRPPDRAPNCLACRHFQVTWETRYPRSCRVFGIKTPRMPSAVVFETTGRHCPAFERSVGDRAQTDRRDPGAPGEGGDHSTGGGLWG